MVSIACVALKPGMELAEDVKANNIVVLKANTVLDDLAINKLIRYSVMCVTIKEEEDYATTRFEKIRLSKAFKEFESVYRNNLNAYKYMINDVIFNHNTINTDYLMKMHNEIAAMAKSRENLLNMLYYMLPSEDDMTYAHCLNAALISNVVGVWLGLNNEDLKILTLCGFLYDIGKLAIPNSILWKPEKLTDLEQSMVKRHTIIGYDMIKYQNLNEHILNATIMHHERNDGSGYPNNLKDDEIDIFAKYIAIVDSYEAMTSARTYRPSLNPFQVIENFERMGFEKFGTSIVKRIMEHVAKTQLGETVRLSNDVVGDVILINENSLSKPLIKNGNNIIDLSKEVDVKIVAIL